MRGKLEEIEDEIRKGRVKGRLNELWALLGAVNASIERGRGGMGEWAVVDDEGLGQIAQVGFFICLRSSLLFSVFEIVAFLDPFGAAGGAGTPHQDFTKVPKRLGGYYGDCGAWWWWWWDERR